MLITHYLFLDSVTKKLNYPNKTFTIDGTSMPLLGNKYYNIYKEYLLNKIKENKIKEILFLSTKIYLKLLFQIILSKNVIKLMKMKSFIF